ncbi:hypothetical protein [Geomonas sp.]|uniref:hypothetical protein n=1 Tax=Geomonas sp. TaxID=2651584 RepID=UPI002B46AF60|nr:hypothetical protein [Geomonas sp.]HJV34595.1 hypothetical protein [Geomonas sp.]
MAGVIWKIIKTAATNVPWARMVQNAPAVVDLVERVKEHFIAGGQHSAYEELAALREENLRLADALQQTAGRVEQLTKALEVVVARQKMLTVATVVSLLLAISSLVVWLVK